MNGRMNSALISIIMPVFNSEKHLKDAINSVLIQDYERWELLIIDDGSTDASLAIAKTYQDERIKILSQPNSGVSAARNAGLKIMRGDFFCFLDADDVLTPQSLSARLQCFRSPDITFADGGVDIYNSDLTVKQRRWIPGLSEDLLKSLVRLDSKCFFGPTWMIRRCSDIDYAFAEDLTHGEDLFFYLSYAALGRYTSTKEVVLKYRKVDGSAMTNLKGLANGYTCINKKIKDLPGTSRIDYIIFSLKTRKAMFLDFTKSQEFKLAIRYLFLGSI